MKDAIYFYRKNGENIAVQVSIYPEGNVKGVIFKKKELLERMISDIPEAKGNLYVLIDGVTFKLDV